MTEPTKPRILNVDDNEAGRYAVTRTLRKAGFEVSEASCGREALERVRGIPDLVLLDVNLPDLNGFEVCKRIKADPETGFIPVVHLTATSVQSDARVEGLEGGADGYLVQPVEPRELIATVKAFLRLKHADERIRHLNQVLRAIRDVNKLIIRERDPVKLIDNACTILVEGRGYRGAMIVLTDPAGTPTAFAKAGIGEEAFEPLAEKLRNGILPPCCEAVREHSGPYLVPNYGEICRCCPLGPNCPSCDNLCMRMLHDGRSFGYLSVALKQGVGSDPEEQSLFGEAARDLAHALRGIEIEKEVTQAEQQRHQAEAQLRQAQKMEALGTLAGGIAHDFNNILGIILGYTEMARYEIPMGGTLYRYLQEVTKATDRAADLVKQILAFSRQSEQQKQPVQIGMLTKETLRMLRASIPTTIEILPKVATRSAVMADPTQLHQVLMNLCTNAAHAMRDHGGVIEVGLQDVELPKEKLPPHSGLEPGLHVELTVKDTGHGIDPADLERIFDPFFTTKAMGEGTGLGLSVVHGIVRSHGGFIEVSSQPGEGSLFRLLFPAVTIEPATEPAEPLPLPMGHERILFVDDEPLLARAGKHILEQLGYRVVLQTSSLEALEVFRSLHPKEPFDLLITDMTMPHLTGIELARELRSLQPGLPVIVCTGFSEKIDAERAKTIGLDGFLMKPVILKELAVLVRQVLDSRGSNWHCEL